MDHITSGASQHSTLKPLTVCGFEAGAASKMFCPKPAEDSPNWMGSRAITNIVPVRRTILFVLLVLGFGVESGVAAAALAAGVPERGAYILLNLKSCYQQFMPCMCVEKGTSHEP